MSINELLGLEETDEKNGKVHYCREWLNTDDGTAYVEHSIKAYEASHYSSSELSANFGLKDCNRQINLEFYFSDEKMRAERLKKVDLLLRELNILRNHIVAFEIKEKIPKEEPKKKKKKKAKKND